MAPQGKRTEKTAEIALRLRSRGYHSISRWAESRGYRPGTVLNAVNFWWGTEKTPHGGIARMIMRDLQKTIGEGTA